MVLVSGFEAWVETPAGRFAISSQRYPPDVVYPDGASRTRRFPNRALANVDIPLARRQRRLSQELFVPHGISACCSATGNIHWCNARAPRLNLRPFFCGRDYHARTTRTPPSDSMPAHQNGWLVLASLRRRARRYLLSPTANIARAAVVPQLSVLRNKSAASISSKTLPPRDPYLRLSREAVLILRRRRLRTRNHALPVHTRGKKSFATASQNRTAPAANISHSASPRRRCLPRPPRQRPNHHRRLSLVHRLGPRYVHLAARPVPGDRSPRRRPANSARLGRHGQRRHAPQSLSRRRRSAGIQFGRRLAVVHRRGARFPRSRRAPQVDQSALQIAARLEHAILAIVEGYSRGTRYGIRMDTDGLLAAGEPGVQLTWMDAKVGDWVVTPRIGKPVEVQALWLNALSIAGRIDVAGSTIFSAPRGIRKTLLERIARLLVRRGRRRSSAGQSRRRAAPESNLRHRRLAAGACCTASERKALSMSSKASCSRRWACARWPPARPATPPSTSARHTSATPPTIKAPSGPGSSARSSKPGSASAAPPPQPKDEARERFLPPLEAHLNAAGLGHISEITDAEPPFTPRGCPFQAWSLGEYLRLKYDVLAIETAAGAGER